MLICKFYFFQDKRNASSVSLDEEAQSSKQFFDSKQSMVDWLYQLEKKLDQDEFQLTFLPLLEDKLEASKVNSILMIFFCLLIRIRMKLKYSISIFIRNILCNSQNNGYSIKNFWVYFKNRLWITQFKVFFVKILTLPLK